MVSTKQKLIVNTQKIEESKHTTTEYYHHKGREQQQIKGTEEPHKGHKRINKRQ